jgi:hypothetical protein
MSNLIFAKAIGWDTEKQDVPVKNRMSVTLKLHCHLRHFWKHQHQFPDILNSDYYYSYYSIVHECVCECNRKKRPGLLWKGMILQ